MSPSQPLPSTPDRSGALAETTATALALVWRRWVPLLSARFGWGFYTTICFAVFLFLTFPVESLLQRVIISATRGTQLYIRYAQGELTWGGAAIVRDVTLEKQDTNLPLLKLTRLAVRPSWLRLPFGQPLPLAFQADLYDGTVDGTVEQSQEGVRTKLTMQRLNLARFPAPTTGKLGGLKGFLTGSSDVSGDFSQIFSLQGALELSVAEGSLPAGTVGKFPVPPLHSIRGNLRASVRDGRVSIADVTLTGDGIEARAQGTITLSTPLRHSGLELQLTAKTVGSPPPPLTALLSLLSVSPNTPGERRATLSGSLAAPVMR